MTASTRLFLTFAALLATGCPAEELVIAGEVQRAATASISAGADGVGTLYIAILEDCEFTAPQAGSVVIPNADLSEGAQSVAFASEALEPGTYHLVYFLDDNLDADPMAPLPGPGDSLYAEGIGDGVLSCVEVELQDDPVTELTLQLTATIPVGS